MRQVRPPAAAGSFYPDDQELLRQRLAALLDAARARLDPRPGDPRPKALIAPHAGYAYSGAVAASAFATLVPFRGAVRRVLLLGPSHFVPFRGLALPGVAALATPLGEVAVDEEAEACIRMLDQVTVLPGAHAREHCLEVELPFLQTVLDELRIVPLIAGAVGPEAVVEVLDLLWADPATVVVVSSDLSHYHGYAAARRRDRDTARAIEQLDPDRIGPDDACGRVPVQGLLIAAQRHGLKARTLDLRNSGDTSGPAARVVGYGAFAFFPPR